MSSWPLSFLPTRFLPLLALLALTAALLWLPSTDTISAQEGQTVPADWALIPDGIEPGDSFRLLFVTSATRDASSSDIADYNAHAQEAAGGNSSLADFSDGFTALISTSAVDAKTNTATTGTGVPIYWLGGEKVADDYADLYDKSWDSVSGVTESGASYTGLVWTGGNKMGEKSGQRYAGAAEVRLGDLGDATLALSSPTVRASGESHPLYALSPVITVAEPEPEPTPTPTPTPTPAPTPEPEPAQDNGPPAIASGPVIASSPASEDTYGAGEFIEISYTFGEAVTVTGDPRARLVVGERKRWAHYSHAGNDGTTLVFAYVVRSDDRDEDGVRVGRNQLKLNGGSIADADGNAAKLRHPALPDQAGHKVDGSQEEAPSEGQQQQEANNEPQFAADTATRSIDENSAAGASVGDAITASDADGDELTYAISGSDAFAIDASTGQIAVVSAPDYETQSSYSVTVTVSDGKNAQGDADAGVDDSIAVTITIVNVDEAGVVSLVSDSDPPHVGVELQAALLDPDGGVSSVSWAWERSADGTDWTAIAGANADAYTPAEDDAGHYLRATASYTDGHGGGKTASAATSGKTLVPPPERGEPQVRLTGTIQSGTSKSNVADLSSGNFTSAARFTACTGTGCTPPTTGGVGTGVKIASVGMTVATTGEISYDGTPIAASVVRIGFLESNAVVRTATITVTQCAATVRDGAVVVPHNWSLLPGGAGPGDQFRLLFVTSGNRNATSVDIADYNDFVAAAANKVAEFCQFNTLFRAVVSTSGQPAKPPTATESAQRFISPVDARDNTGTNFRSDGAGVPIYWLKGDKVADHYRDFWDKTWDSYEGRNEQGNTFSEAVKVWTGSKPNGKGQVAVSVLSTTVDGRLGHNWAVRGALPSDEDKKGSHIDNGFVTVSSAQSSLYALSPVITVDLYPAPEPQSVPDDWPLIPEGLGVGDSFRLVFVTGGGWWAWDSGIGAYNERAQLYARSNPHLADTEIAQIEQHQALDPSLYKHFRAVISTEHVDAYYNTLPRTLREEVPVYWLGGDRVADSYDGFYQSPWLSREVRKENGRPSSAGEIWTGSDSAGLRDGDHYAGSKSGQVRTGRPGEFDWRLQAPDRALPIYALSPVITVVDTTAPAITRLAVTSNPGSDRIYAQGDTLRVTFTFDEAITVTGTPELEVQVGFDLKTADCARHASDATGLVCSYTVAAGDLDVDGVSVRQNSLDLPTGATIKDRAGNALSTPEHDPLPDQTGHRVVAVTAGAGGPVVRLTVSPTRIPEDGGMATITATLSKPAGQALTIRCACIGSSITIPKGRTTGTIQFTTSMDDMDGPDWTNTLPVYYSPAGVVDPMSDQGYTFTVVDNDPTPVVTLQARRDATDVDGDGDVDNDRYGRNLGAELANAALTEGGAFVIWPTLDRPSSEQTRVRIAVELLGSDDILGYDILSRPFAETDWHETGPYVSYVIEPGETQPEPGARLVVVSTRNDHTFRPDARLRVTATATNAHAITAPRPLSVRIIDDDVITSRPTRPDGCKGDNPDYPACRGGTYGEGEVIEAAIQFSRPVAVSGSPALTLSLESGDVSAAYSHHQGSVVYFRYYSVKAGDSDADGIRVTNDPPISGGTITDAASGEAATVVTPLPLDPLTLHRVDGSATRLGAKLLRLEVARGSTGPYLRGDAVKVQAVFDSHVRIKGIPWIDINLGGHVCRARYSGYEDSRKPMFSCPVGYSDYDPDGFSVPAGYIGGNWPVDNYIHVGGKRVQLAHKGLADQGASHVVDGWQKPLATPPTVTKTVTIDLGSPKDDYMTLWEGGRSGKLLESDDDDGPDNDSRIERTLESGTYTIEATTFNSTRTGPFKLTVSGLGGSGELRDTTDTCTQTLTGDGTFDGTWASNCPADTPSRSGSYARYYTFTIPEGQPPPPPIGAPRDVRATPADGAVLLTWDFPVKNTEAAITGWMLWRSDDQRWVTISEDKYLDRYLVTGLENGKEYTFRLRARWGQLKPLGGVVSEAVSATPMSGLPNP